MSQGLDLSVTSTTPLLETTLDELDFQWSFGEGTYIGNNVEEFSQDTGAGHMDDLSELLQHLHPTADIMPAGALSPPVTERENPTHRPKTISVSSSFFAGSHNSVTDVVLRSSDNVLFYVSSQTILASCPHGFEEFLGFSLDDKRARDTILDIPESSVVLNIIMHTMYGLSCAKHNPPFEDIESAVDRMPVYGLAPKDYIKKATPLFELLLSHAPLYPMPIYSLAGHFDIEDLAVKTSSHLLSYDLADMSDELAKRMGARYLRRLMSLHLCIFEALKAVILQPPHPHPTTLHCTFEDQRKLSRAWALVASYLAWDFRPDLSIHTVQSTFLALGDRLTCDDCKNGLHFRIKEVVTKWVKVPVSD